ncbi:MAG: hypothetical protein LBU50_05495, partial [Cellulomonas sp.]|nr:hypothetical protein [Cellulomonas sp.]
MSEPQVCVAAPVAGVGELQVRDSSGLVWPEKFAIRDDTMKLEPVSEAATVLGTMASRLVESTGQIATTWTGLQGCYSSPEAAAVHALMVPVQAGGEEVGGRLNSAKAALEDYVAALEGLRGRLSAVVADCESFRAEAVAGVWLDASKTSKANVGDYLLEGLTLGHHDRKVHVAWDEDGAMVARNEALVDRYAAVVSDVMNAAITCANTIAALPGMPAELAGQPPVEGVSPEEVVALWGPAATEDRSCMEQTGDGLYDFGTGVLEGGGMLLLGYDPETGRFFSGEAYGQAWGGLGNLVGSVGVMAVYGAAVVLTGGQITQVSFGEAGDRWLYDRAVVVRDAGASLVGYDPYAPDGDGWHTWRDEPWRAGTATVANVGTFF